MPVVKHISKKFTYLKCWHLISALFLWNYFTEFGNRINTKPFGEEMSILLQHLIPVHLAFHGEWAHFHFSNKTLNIVYLTFIVKWRFCALIREALEIFQA